MEPDGLFSLRASINMQYDIWITCRFQILHFSLPFTLHNRNFFRSEVVEFIDHLVNLPLLAYLHYAGVFSQYLLFIALKT